MADQSRHTPSWHSASWHIVRRRMSFVGERRANVVRLAGILGFYGIELINHHGVDLGFLQLPAVEGVDDAFHAAATALAGAWTVFAIAVAVCLRQRVFPESLKYLTSAGDLALLTSLLLIADGPSSPLVACYFVVLAVASTRQSLGLIRFATVGAIAGYLVLCGHARWFTDRDIAVPRFHQAIVVLALVLTGVVLGQMVRTVRTAAQEYGARVGEERAVDEAA